MARPRIVRTPSLGFIDLYTPRVSEDAHREAALADLRRAAAAHPPCPNVARGAQHPELMRAITDFQAAADSAAVARHVARRDGQAP